MSYSAGAIARTNAFFGQGTGPIWLDDLLCSGNERRLVDCPVSTGGIGMVDFCNGHADDAGVTCQERKHSSWTSSILCCRCNCMVHNLQLALVVASDWSMETFPTRVELRFAKMKHGVQSVMTFGLKKMPE